MQIHELTQRQLDEGFMDAVNKVAAKAAPAMKAAANSRAGQAVGQAAQQATQYANTQYNKGVAQGGGGIGGAIQGAANVTGGVAGKTVAAAKGLGSAIASPFKQVGNAFRQAGVAQKAAGTAGKAQQAWNSYLENLQNTQQVTPQVAETNLRAWVQKNLLGNLAYQYDQLTNKNEIEDMIKSIADPRNADAGKQTQLWTQLVKTLGVAQVGGGAAVAGVAPKGRKGAPAGGLAPTANPGDIAKAIQGSGITPALYQNIATVVQGAAATKQIKGTDNPSVNAFLKSLGFTVQ
jgi:hypothetical protein